MPYFAPAVLSESLQPDEEMAELHRILELSSREHRVGDYLYVPHVALGQPRAFKITRKGMEVYRYRPEIPDLGNCFLVEPFASSSLTGITSKFDRLSEDIIDSAGTRLPLDSDITGGGISNLIVGVWTGGAHCCFNYNILSLGAKFRKLATIQGIDSEFCFKDLDGDEVFEAVGYDHNFRYWHECFAASPAPLVILTLKEGRAVLAESLMKTPALSGK